MKTSACSPAEVASYSMKYCAVCSDDRDSRFIKSPAKVLRWSKSHLSLALGVLLLAVLPGCTLCQNVKRSVLSEPTRFSVTADRWRSIRIYREWADEAYSRFCGCGDQVPFSDAYAVGFKDGFVDYVYGGGSGEPPPVPPREYWDVRNRNPQGNACADDWFDGYRHGARIARDEGYRERALIPTSKLVLCPTETCRRELPRLQAQPIPTIKPEWLEAESIPLGPVEPAPIPETNTSELAPTDENPPAEIPPAMDVPQYVPEIEAAPMPEPDQPGDELETAPLVPEPDNSESIESEPTPPTEEQEPEEYEYIDELFSPKATQNSTPRKMLPVRASPKECLGAQQARAAFATALQRNQQAKTVANTKPYRSKIQQVNAELPQMPRKQQTNAGLIHRPPSIPRANDRSKEMFRQLSH